VIGHTLPIATDAITTTDCEGRLRDPRRAVQRSTFRWLSTSAPGRT